MIRYIARLGLPGLLLACVVLAVFASPLGATSISWNVNAGGSFNAGGNWAQSGLPVDSDGVPDASDVVTFRRGSGVGVAVNFPGTGHSETTPVDYVTDRLLVGSNTVSFADVPLGAASTYAVGNAATTEAGRGIIVGVTGSDTAAVLTSTLPIFSGAAATIGDAAGSNGTLTFNAGTFSVTGSSITDDELIVGNHGTGALHVNNGADVTLGHANGNSVLGKYTGSSGTATISGAGSIWTNVLGLTVGNLGAGTLTITGGGQASNGSGYIGKESGSTGTASVTGAGSTWTNGGDLSVGYSGQGTLNITGGGQVSNGSAYIGKESGSTGLVSVAGTGSTWTNGEDLSVGYSGQGTLNITGGGQVSNGHAYIGKESGSTGTVGVAGTGSKWRSNTGDLHVGYSGSGTLNITSGGECDFVSGIGEQIGSTGTVNVDGTNSTMLLRSAAVGRQGSGTLNITNGAVVVESDPFSPETTTWIGELAGSTGLVSVAGAGSGWICGNLLYIGSSGSGTLNITNGGTVYHSYNGGIPVCSIGSDIGSTGVATVDGAGSAWILPGKMFLGHFGHGTLSITSGGQVTSGSDGSIGTVGGSTGTVSIAGSGSKWTNGGNLSVGDFGIGTVNVTSGGVQVVNGTGYIGRGSGAIGTVSVDGFGSSWISNGDLFVGGNISGAGGMGTLSVQNGGSLAVHNRTNLWSSSSITVNGGTFTTGSLASLSGTPSILLSDPTGVAMTVGSDNTSSAFGGTIANAAGGPGSLTKVGSGTLTLSGTNTCTGGTTINGGTLAVTGSMVGPVAVNAGGKLQGTGSVGGTVTVNPFGSLAPGNSPGILTVGSLILNNGSQMNIELGGTNRGSQFDALIANGNVSLGGTLNVTLSGGFRTATGDTFDVLDWGTRNGMFDLVLLPTLGGQIVWDSSHLYDSGALGGTLSVTATYYVGDFNRDQHVNAADIPAMLAALVDLNAYKAAKGLDATQLLTIGDVSGDGKLNNGDVQALLTFLKNGGGSITAVPEPASIVLMALALPGLALAVARQRGSELGCGLEWCK